MTEADIRRKSIDTIRALAMDAVQQANAGHPGTAMALAPLAGEISPRRERAASYRVARERQRHLYEGVT